MPSEHATENQASETLAASLRRLLHHCYDPVLPLNIVDLGLIHTLQVSPAPEAPGAGIPGVPERFHVHLDLLTATDDEAAQTQLRAQVDNLLAGLPAVWRATVRLLAEPAWSPSLISAEGRRTLKLDQPTPFAILNNRLR